MSKQLTRKDILEVIDLPTQEVEVPEWGGSVMVRGLNGTERDQYEQSLLSMNGTSVELNLAGARARLVSLACVDEAGQRLFTAKDIEALGRKSGTALDRVFQVVQKLSGLSNEDMQELTANFTLAPTGASSSSLRGTSA